MTGPAAYQRAGAAALPAECFLGPAQFRLWRLGADSVATRSFWLSLAARERGSNRSGAAA
jgi:hypothetical protein